VQTHVLFFAVPDRTVVVDNPAGRCHRPPGWRTRNQSAGISRDGPRSRESPPREHADASVEPRPPLTLLVHVPQVSPPKRPVSARAYLRQPPDATSADTWTAAAENLGRYSNRMPIDPLRIARAHNGSESHCSGKRRPHTARTPPGSTGRKAKGGLDFNFGRTPSIAQTMVSKPANEGGGRASGKKVPKYAEYQSMGSIPSVSRASMSMVGDGGNHTQARRNKLRWNASLAATAPGSLLGQNIPGSPMAVGGLESPIYIEKHLVAEWTSDSTMHPLLLSKRPKGWSATPIEAVPKGSHDLTAAKLATTKSRMRHMITNEFPPSIRSFFLDGLDSEKESESDSDSESVPPTPKEGGKVSKGPDPACAGNGLVQANDDRCKVGTKVKIAFSFCTEEWAAHLVGKGKLILCIFCALQRC